MPSFFIKLILLPLFLFTFASASIFLESDTKQNKVIYSSIINSTLKDLSPIFKQSTQHIIKKLTIENIKVRDEEQTIVQIALSNAKQSQEILDIILLKSNHLKRN